jgi:S-adenosylmethionine synthetase
MSVLVDTFGSSVVPEEDIIELVSKYFDLTPRGIMDTLKLRRPLYKQVAAYGHFGRTDLNVPWEETDMAAILKKAAGL